MLQGGKLYVFVNVIYILKRLFSNKLGADAKLGGTFRPCSSQCFTTTHKTIHLQHIVCILSVKFSVDFGHIYM